MENLKAKLKKQGGFTMVELLIVVAIIGILAAVSIPMFSNALERARHGVDAANVRSAVSLATAEVAADLKPADNFSNWVEYKYVVNKSATSGNEHQAHLSKKTTDTAVEASCAEAPNDLGGLTVKVKYDLTAGTSADDRIKVFASWDFDSDGHVVKNTSYPT